MTSTQRSSHKKRPAPASGGGPSSKKPHISKSVGGKEKAEKKRSRPVTAPVVEADEDEDEEGVFDEDALDEVIAEHDSDEMQVDPVFPKDPNGTFRSIFLIQFIPYPSIPAARESHKAQKLLASQRRASKPHSQILTEAKRLWALVRQKNIPTSERKVYVKELMGVIRGKVKDIVLKHDASRIVQSVVKYGGQEERDEIAGELKGGYRELAGNRYSKVRIHFL